MAIDRALSRGVLDHIGENHIDPAPAEILEQSGEPRFHPVEVEVMA